MTIFQKFGSCAFVALHIGIWNVFANEEKLLTKASFSNRLREERQEIHGAVEIMTADMSAVIIAPATGVNR